MGCTDSKEERRRNAPGTVAVHNPYQSVAPQPPPPQPQTYQPANPYQTSPQAYSSPPQGYGAPPGYGKPASPVPGVPLAASQFRVPGFGEQPVRAPPRRPPPPPSGRKRALLVGMNYPGTRAALRGCINDVKRMREMLLHRGWRQDEMRILTDDGGRADTRPTKANIIQGLHWLVQGVVPGDVMFFHYSGHGAQKEDPHGLEEDGMNETLIPEDFQRAGMITDDEVFEIIVRPLPDGARLTAVLDCCHSGTGLDLPLTWAGDGWREATNPWHTLGDVILFSGCDDDQTSADASDQYRRPAGAMTTALCDSLQAQPNCSMSGLMVAMYRRLRQGRFSQRPQLTSSQPFDANQRRFDLEDICPNMNETVGRIFRRKFKPRPSMKQSPLSDMLVGAGVLAAGAVVGIVAMEAIGGGVGDLVGGLLLGGLF